MKTILIILGSEPNLIARGQFNESLFNTAKKILSKKYKILTTVLDEGYDLEDEVSKFKQADFIIYQYPIYWFTHPASLKEYIDDVFRYGSFFSFDKGSYNPIGLLKGKKFMLSTTWNAPKEKFNDKNSFLGNHSVEDFLLPIRKSNTFCGIEELKHFSSHNLVMNPMYEENEKRFIKHLKKVFKL